MLAVMGLFLCTLAVLARLTVWRWSRVGPTVVEVSLFELKCSRVWDRRLKRRTCLGSTRRRPRRPLPTGTQPTPTTAHS